MNTTWLSSIWTHITNINNYKYQPRYCFKYQPVLSNYRTIVVIVWSQRTWNTFNSKNGMLLDLTHALHIHKTKSLTNNPHYCLWSWHLKSTRAQTHYYGPIKGKSIVNKFINRMRSTGPEHYCVCAHVAWPCSRGGLMGLRVHCRPPSWHYFDTAQPPQNQISSTPRKKT